MTIGLLKEPSPETRVSLLPEAVASLTKKNITVLIETGAGEKLLVRMQIMKKPEPLWLPGNRCCNLQTFC